MDVNQGFVPTPIDAFERLFFALFGLQRPEDLKMNNHVEDWTLQIFKLIFGAYLLMAGIVLINLLIAMMSDTYQRIQVQIIFFVCTTLKSLNRRACSLRFFRFSFYLARNFSCNKRNIPPCLFINLLSK